MKTISSKTVLWDNISRLMIAKYGKISLTKLANDVGIGPGTMTRIKDQQTSVGADVIDQVAVALEVQAWQLLMPPGAPAALAASGKKYSPIATLLAEDFDALLGGDLRLQLEGLQGCQTVLNKLSGRLESVRTGQPAPARKAAPRPAE